MDNIVLFDSRIAEELGIEESIIIYKIYGWISHNAKNGKHLHDGKCWTYMTAREFSEEFPFMSEKKVGNILRDLVVKGYLVKSNFNKSLFDRTSWYSFGEALISLFQKLNIHIPKLEDGSSDNVEPIPTYNNKQDEYKQHQKKEKELEKENWREDFLTYRHIVDEAAKRLKDDVGQRNLFLKYNPNADYDMTIDKSVDMFWGTEDGWNHKKRSKSKNIDMVATLKKALQQRMNICYKPFEQRGSVMSDTSSGKKQGQLSMDDFIEMRRKAGRPI